MDSSPVAVRYARSGTDDVAWAEEGAGEPVLIGGWWMSHLQRDVEYPPLRRFLAVLARYRRVIRMDTPGNGLSRSRNEMPATLEPHVEAMKAVLDAADISEATVLAGSSGAAVAVEFAARYPHRVRRMVLTGSYLDGRSISTPADREALFELVRSNWGVSSRVMADLFYPDASPEQRRAWVRHQRSVATGHAAASALQAVHSFDARSAAQGVQAPTLVLHRREDRAIRLALGAAVAEAIPGARLEVLEGSAHHPWHGDAASLLRHALAFDGTTVADADLQGASGRARGTVLVTADSPLSAREHEVLLLVSQGLTDAQIAAELFLSPHTVHRHVANARSKLEVSSRAAAAAWVTAHPSPEARA